MQSNLMRGIRGAITVDDNTEKAIGDAAQKLVSAMLSENNISTEDIVSIMFTVTSDLNAAFPAAAVRNLAGFSLVPMICALEIDVPDSLKRCIRVLMLVNTDAEQSDIRHIYLNGATRLRPDLT